MSDPADEHEAETPEVAEEIFFDVPNPTFPGQKGSLLIMFQIMQAQIQNQQLAVEKRMAAQQEEMRMRSQEDRLQLAQFLTDEQLHAEKSDGGSSSNFPEKLQQNLKRLDGEAKELLGDLKARCNENKLLHEVEVIHTALEGAMCDLKTYLDSKIDNIQDDGIRDAILTQYRLTKSRYFEEAASAKSTIAKLKAALDENKLAGPLPDGVSPPIFDGDKMKFPTFWDAFCPLVHENPRVSRFFKMTYLKGAMRSEASGVLDGFTTIAENYEAAVDAVKKRFGRNQAIFRSRVGDILNGGKIDANVKQLRGLLDKILPKKQCYLNTMCSGIKFSLKP